MLITYSFVIQLCIVLLFYLKQIAPAYSVNDIIMQAKCQALIQMETDCSLMNILEVDCYQPGYRCHAKNITGIKCCDRFCTCMRDTNNLLKFGFVESKSEDLKLICRSDHKLFVGLPTKDKWNVVLVTAIYDLLNETQSKIVMNESSVMYDKLVANNSYTFKTWAVDELGIRYFYSKVFNTLSTNFKPKPVRSLELEAFVPVNNTVEALISWIPGPDRTCDYELIWWDHFDGIHTKELLVPFHPFKYTLNNLKFGTIYKVEICSKDSEWYSESDRIGLTFTTPTCIELYDETVCKPPNTLQINVTEVYLGASKFDVFVTWEPPAAIPEYYNFTLVGAIIKDRHENVSLTAPSNAKTILFHAVQLANIYSVKGQAVYKNELVWDIVAREISAIDETLWNGSAIIRTTAYTFSITFVLILLTVWFITRQLQKRKLWMKTVESNENSLQAPGDFYEIDIKQLVLYEKLGQGEFGIVRKAKLLNFNGQPSKIVAVKMLISSMCKDDIRRFWEEIDVMCKVGSHPNIVSIIGYSSLNSKTIFFVSEYCTKGDLQNYLRKTWNEIVYSNTPTSKTTNLNHYVQQYANTYVDDFKHEYMQFVENELPINFAENLNYDLELAVAEFKITTKDLLTYAKSIASGMEFLSAKSVVHRDLAARNILVCSDNTVKIADFGLSKDIYHQKLYKKFGTGKLPVKWMAPESLKHQIYTSSSDVWSFGILLWEIMTLGATPYPAIPTATLLEILCSGYRMGRPIKCSIELYSIMLACWNFKPNQRPTFSSIRSALSDMLEKDAKRY
ncbi:tyrosine-protein kinase receptor torso-like isoform X2 [Ctenocephalides felis]|uniref:tyrosine-protein kinase receptor torso-like isoform X2 n=1 Tax=Ctenocephalides felis TaxID=7515 RepID=UPI000E6E234B|nr:tyrosine-protein kinase receptor torso-like isoform X2 [Ctenocephalides felis]